MKVSVSYLDWFIASKNWENEAPWYTHETFNMFLDGQTCEYSMARDAVIMDEGAARKIQMLVGPHYKAIIKAWFIRNEHLRQCMEQR